jgi:hypothetical protein
MVWGICSSVILSLEDSLVRLAQRDVVGTLRTKLCSSVEEELRQLVTRMHKISFTETTGPFFWLVPDLHHKIINSVE